MKVIFKRTLEDTLKISSIIICLIAGAAAGYLLGRNSSYGTVPAFQHYLNGSLIKQHIAVFFLINGAILITIISSVSSGLIAGEVHDGTLKILITKPNSRSTVLFAKILGMVVGISILMFLELAVMYIVEVYTGNFDGNIVNGLIGYLPAYVLYGYIVMFFFSSLGVLLSCIASRKVIALLPLLAVMVMVLGLPIILRIMMAWTIGGSMSARIYPIDLNYHFGSMFRWCCELFGGIHGTSNQLEIPTLLMNIFNTATIDNDLVRASTTSNMVVVNDIIPAGYILTVYLLLGCINYVSSFIIIRKKNV